MAVQSCCPAREVVELKVGAQVMLLKVGKNKEESPSECSKRIQLVRIVRIVRIVYTHVEAANCVPGKPRHSMIRQRISAYSLLPWALPTKESVHNLFSAISAAFLID